MLAFYQLPAFFLVMSKRSIFWEFCTLVFFSSREGNLLSAVDIIEFWMFVVFFFSLHPIYNVVLDQWLWKFRSPLRKGIICLYPQVNSTWY